MTVLVLAAAYMLGMLPTALIVGRRIGFDPTSAESGNPGASNAFRLGGRRAGAVVLAGDLGKGVVASFAGMAIGGRPLALAAGAMAVLGHVYPLVRGGHGGKGVATALGVVLVLEPWLALAGVAVWLVVAGITRVAALGSIALVTTVAFAVAIIGRPTWEVLGLTAVGVVVEIRHRGNLSRLVREAPAHKT
jgi:glycerol-3-phosphate acyltransferase PlsY